MEGNYRDNVSIWRIWGVHYIIYAIRPCIWLLHEFGSPQASILGHNHILGFYWGQPFYV